MKRNPLHRVLVCGGRNFTNRLQVFRTLDSFHRHTVLGIRTIIHGDANGADELADDWAESRGIQVEAYPADWRRYGRRAGSIRNRSMLKHGNPDIVIAFPGGAGTHHMIDTAGDAGISVIIIRLERFATRIRVPL